MTLCSTHEPVQVDHAIMAHVQPQQVIASLEFLKPHPLHDIPDLGYEQEGFHRQRQRAIEILEFIAYTIEIVERCREEPFIKPEPQVLIRAVFLGDIGIETDPDLRVYLWGALFTLEM